MPTLYVQNIPTELYEALRRRARANRKSIAAEVLLLLEQNVVTAAEQRSRQKFLREVLRLRRYRQRRRAAARPCLANPVHLQGRLIFFREVERFFRL